MSEFQELLVEEIQDLYDAEKQLTKALPKMAKAASHQELRQAFQDHLEMTQNQIARLEQAFELLGERAKSKPCKAMKGLVEEGQEHIQEHEKGPMLDAALIGAAQKVEHYEISGYGTARALAKALGHRDVAGLLDETAKEEGATDKLLTQISLRMMKEAMSARPEDVDDEMPEMRGGRGGRGMASSRGGNGRSAMGGGRGMVKKKVGSSRKNGVRSGGGSGSLQTTDHDEIRQWAEERGAKPACVRGTGKKGGVGMIRLDFPGYTGAEKLQEITWDEWFESFDENNLALVYQEKTARGQQSNFNKLVSRESVAGGRSARRR
jgi:ferritin-like metal-binding protein YciE